VNSYRQLTQKMSTQQLSMNIKRDLQSNWNLLFRQLKIIEKPSSIRKKSVVRLRLRARGIFRNYYSDKEFKASRLLVSKLKK
jgi:hypothetical protein